LDLFSIVAGTTTVVCVGLAIVCVSSDFDKKSTFLGELKGRLLQSGLALGGAVMGCLSLLG
jgi:hypothetical protein